MNDVLEPVEANALYLLAKYRKIITQPTNRELRGVIKSEFARDVLAALDGHTCSQPAMRHANALLTR